MEHIQTLKTPLNSTAVLKSTTNGILTFTNALQQNHAMMKAPVCAKLAPVLLQPHPPQHLLPQHLLPLHQDHSYAQVLAHSHILPETAITSGVSNFQEVFNNSLTHVQEVTCMTLRANFVWLENAPQ
jgi:hypothetical protein